MLHGNEANLDRFACIIILMHDNRIPESTANELETSGDHVPCEWLYNQMNASYYHHGTAINALCNNSDHGL